MCPTSGCKNSQCNSIASPISQWFCTARYVNHLPNHYLTSKLQYLCGIYEFRTARHRGVPLILPCESLNMKVEHGQTRPRRTSSSVDKTGRLASPVLQRLKQIESSMAMPANLGRYAAALMLGSSSISPGTMRAAAMRLPLSEK